MDSAVKKDLYTGGSAFRFEHIGNVLCGAIAEKLAQRLLVVRDVMFFNEGDEIRGGVAGQGGFRKVFVRGDEVFRPAMEIREIAAASAGDQDFLTDFICAFDHGDAASAFAGLDGAKQSGGSGAKDQSVKFMNQGRVSSNCGISAAGFPRRLHSRLN
jgi:hypothetical protein